MNKNQKDELAAAVAAHIEAAQDAAWAKLLGMTQGNTKGRK